MDQRHQDYCRRVDPQIDNELDMGHLTERLLYSETLFQQHKRRSKS